MLAATRRFAETGSDTPQLDATLLLGDVLGVNKAWLYAHPTRELTESEIVHYEDLVRRRMRHEPVAYLLGFKPFYGLDITVDRSVLIPRPETELLVDRVLDYLQSLAGPGRRLSVADVGTGSGAIAVALAANVPELTVYAVDVSDAALAVAAQNVQRHGLGAQVQLLQGHLIEPLHAPVDVIVANLPYIATADLADLPPQVRDLSRCWPWTAARTGLRSSPTCSPRWLCRRAAPNSSPAGAFTWRSARVKEMRRARG